MEYLIRPPVKLGVFFILILSLNSCAWLNRFNLNKSPKKYQTTYAEKDYTDQLDFQGEVYLKERRNKIIRLRSRSNDYFGKLVQKLKNSNEKYFQGSELTYRLTVIRDKTPFYFALPSGKIIISTGVLKKYIDNENLLSVILAKMLFVATKKVYIKKISIPRGTVSTIEMMKLVDLPLSVRAEVNKWTFHLLNRAGFDGLAVLNWIQIQNKSILDFSMMYKDLNLISREEFEFKNFIVTGRERLLPEEEANSSQEFYLFKKDVLRSATIIPVRRVTN